MDKYYQILGKVLSSGKMQSNKKGNIRYLLNEQLTLLPADLLDIFEGHTIARKKLKNELQLFMRGERNVEKYREAGINWWDYCGSILVNSYPTYFEKLPPLIERINREKRNSKNYILFLGSTGTESNQAPCLSLVQFQIEQGELVMTAYQRSSDANLGLPADIYHLYLISRQIELPLKSITLNLGNVHIYENNIDKTEQLLAGNENVKFENNNIDLSEVNKDKYQFYAVFNFDNNGNVDVSEINGGDKEVLKSNIECSLIDIRNEYDILIVIMKKDIII